MTHPQGPQKLLYVSGPLTVMTEEQRERFREFYEGIARIGEEAGYFSYLPHVHGDPTLMPNLTPQDIDRIDRRGVASSYVMIAYIGTSVVGASHGTAIEVEIANHANVPVILVYEDVKSPSRLILGNPSVVDKVILGNWSASFTSGDFEESFRRISEALDRFDQKMAETALPDSLRHVRAEKAPASA